MFGQSTKSEIFSEVKKLLSLAGPLVLVNLLLCCLQIISVMFVGHLGELALSGASMATSFASVTGFSFMLKRLLSLAVPVVLVNLLLYCLQMVSVMFVGHLGALALSGASMATSFASVTGFSFMIGMGSALDTFCGQSYGAKQYHMLGIHMQRAMFVLLTACIPVTIIWYNAGTILLHLRQDPEISDEAGLYARYLIPAIFAFALLQCHIRFLQTQNNVVPMMVTTGVTMLLHVPICWILVFKSGLGNKGAALANGISYYINVFLLGIYVRISPSCKNTWTGFSMKALDDVPKFLRLAVPSAVMLCLETWSFEMMVLLSGLLPNPKLETSVLSISLNTSSMVFMISLGLGGAISIRVSNELGAGRTKAAQLAIRVVLLITIIEGILVGGAMIIGRKAWGYCYSNEEQVVKYVAEMLVFVAVSHFLDGIQSIFSGIARGCGKQTICAFANLGAYYLIGIPTAILLAFHYHIGGKGLWIGLIVALLVQTVLLMLITLFTNWDREAKKAKDRSCDSMAPDDVALPS